MKIKLALSSLFVATALFNASTQASVVTHVTANNVVSDYANTKYPLVFAHGDGGFSRIGTDTLGVDYWYQS